MGIIRHLGLGADRRHVGPQLQPIAELPVLRAQAPGYMDERGLVPLDGLASFEEDFPLYRP
jgi:hypothetical protein